MVHRSSGLYKETRKKDKNYNYIRQGFLTGSEVVGWIPLKHCGVIQ